MGVLREIVSAERINRLRALRDQSLRKGDMAVQGWFIAIVFIRFTANCGLALRELSSGSRAVGEILAEFSMFHLLIVVFLSSFLFSSLSLGTYRLDRKRLSLSPLPFRTVFASDLARMALNPMVWLVVPFIIPALLPLLRLPFPLLAILAMAGVFLFSNCAAWALCTALSCVPGARGFERFFSTAFSALLLVLLLANFDFTWDGGAVTLFVFQHPTLLEGSGLGFLPRLRPWFPSSWIMKAGLGSAFMTLPAFLAPAAAFAAFFLFSRLSHVREASTEEPRTVRRKSASGAKLGVPGSIFNKEARYLILFPRIIFSAAIALGSSIWAIFEPALPIPLAGAVLASAISFSYPSNILGHDGSAIRRYALASVDWRKTFLGKNLAYLAFEAPLSLLVISTAVGISCAAAVSLFLSIVLVLILAMAWGNLSSIIFPSAADGPRGERRTIFVNQVFPWASWGIPLAIHCLVGAFGTALFDAVTGACILFSAFIFAIFLRKLPRLDVEDVLGRF